MLQERNEGRRDAHYLLGRDIHVVYFVGQLKQELLAAPHRDAAVDELPFLIQEGVGLGNGVFVLLVGREIDDLVGDHGPDLDPPLYPPRRGGGKGGQRQGSDAPGQLRGNDRSRLCHHLAGIGIENLFPQGLIHQLLVLVGHSSDDLAIRGFDEPKVVHLAIGSQPTDEADVGPFGGLDGADAAIVTVVHIAHVEARPLAPQPAWTQGRQGPLVSELCQGVGLLHELGQLAAAEELADDGHHRADVD